jgi:hypothetical protein
MIPVTLTGLHLYYQIYYPNRRLASVDTSDTAVTASAIFVLLRLRYLPTLQRDQLALIFNNSIFTH